MLIGSFIYYSYGLADDFTDVNDTEGDKTYQKCGVPNATGLFANGGFEGDPRYTPERNPASGPFYHGSASYYFRAHSPGGFEHVGPLLGFDLSRVSSVYQNKLTEARPDNITVQVWKRIA